MKVLSFILSAYLAVFPLLGEAWFFNAAQAQDTGEFSDISLSPANVQTMELLASAVTMTSDLKPYKGAFVEIKDGEALQPIIGASGTFADVIESGESTTTSVYIVQPGDSVAKVASRFGISENTLRFANGMKKTDVLHRGDILLILPVSGIKYTVKSGDTLNSIAKKYKLGPEDFADMLDYNNLEATSGLVIGDQLILPGVELSDTSAPSSTKSSSKNTPSKKTTTSTANVTRGYFIKPVPCPLSQGKHDNVAVDMACGYSGVPIKAAAAGTVIRVSEGWSGGYGTLVVIQHPNGMITFYAHMIAGSPKVTVGQQVKQGQVIGLIGSTGRSTGPHLHFEVRNGVNPGFDRTGSAWKQ